MSNFIKSFAEVCDEDISLLVLFHVVCEVADEAKLELTLSFLPESM